MTIEFQAWPKTPRLFRDIIITEKVNGTNSAIIIEEAGEGGNPDAIAHVYVDGIVYDVGAQSRNRLIFPGKATDNHGFAAFVEHNAEELVKTLGVGRHYGEWWGDGIQGCYDTTVRGFALFNTEKWQGLHKWLPGPSADREVLLESVPVLYEGTFSEAAINKALFELRDTGSIVSPFDSAEGIVIFHTQSRKAYKVTLDANDKGKWELGTSSPDPQTPSA